MIMIITTNNERDMIAKVINYLVTRYLEPPKSSAQFIEILLSRCDEIKLLFCYVNLFFNKKADFYNLARR